MKPLQIRLQEVRKRLGVPWEVLERDYLLSWVLAGISQIESLNSYLVFKGGTALKKCYFGDYRFSEDLDFSALQGAPSGAAMEKAVKTACEAATKLLDEYAPAEITCERYAEKELHPGGQEAFTIRARFSWHREPQVRVMVETTMDETVLKGSRKRKLLHEYGEPLEAEVLTYEIEEIVAEKLRAILQHIEKLETRGWSRSRARDYYDLWRILGQYKDQMDLKDFEPFLRQKCTLRNVKFGGPDDFFREPMLSYIKKTWEQWLGPLVPNLPSADTVLADLQPQITTLIAPSSSKEQ